MFLYGFYVVSMWCCVVSIIWFLVVSCGFMWLRVASMWFHEVSLLFDVVSVWFHEVPM